MLSAVGFENEGVGKLPHLLVPFIFLIGTSLLFRWKHYRCPYTPQKVGMLRISSLGSHFPGPTVLPPHIPDPAPSKRLLSSSPSPQRALQESSPTLEAV